MPSATVNTRKRSRRQLFAILVLRPGMRLLVLVFAVSIVVLLAAAWAVVRAVRRYGKQSAGPSGSLGLSATHVDEGTDGDEH